MPQVSAEIRWFLDAAHVAQVDDFTRWFRGGPLSAGGGRERRDVYAHDPSTDEFGVKARGQKPGVELKVLVVPLLGKTSLGAREATIQIWSKVTASIIAVPDARRTTRKVRWLRKFDTSGATATEVKLEELEEEPKSGPRLDIGCNAEWTSVSVDGNPRAWWTFGLEAFAFGSHGSVEATLEAGLRKALSALEDRLGPAPALGADWVEQSYPAWLRSL